MRVFRVLIGALLAVPVALALTIAIGAQAQEPHRVYLPIITEKPFTGPASEDPDLLALLEASRDLTYPSESDYGFDPFVWEAPPGVDPVAVCETIAQQEGRSVEQRTLRATFARLIDPGPGASPAELALAGRYANLVATAASRLRYNTVCRVGQIHIDVYIIGISRAGYLVGLHTVAIET